MQVGQPAAIDVTIPQCRDLLAFRDRLAIRKTMQTFAAQVPKQTEECQGRLKGVFENDCRPIVERGGVVPKAVDCPVPRREHGRPRRRENVDTEMNGARFDAFDTGAEGRIVVDGAVLVIATGSQPVRRYSLHAHVHGHRRVAAVQSSHDLSRLFTTAVEPRFETIAVIHPAGVARRCVFGYWGAINLESILALNKIYDGSEPVRVNKWLAQSGVCSRREADALIEQGLVRIDGERFTDAGRKILPGQTLTLDQGGVADLDAKLTILYHKPVGIVSGQPEPGETPAVRMIRRANVYGPADVYPDNNSRLAPVGRLDKDSHGLLILSEDGVLAKAIVGPDSELEKEYHVEVRGPLFEEKLKWLRHGLELDGKKLKPAKVTQTGPQSLTFVLTEGRNRQIRRMCDMCELRVVDLYRDRIGPLRIGNLPEGQWRLITPDERAALLRA